jgi:hypothetical protein
MYLPQGPDRDRGGAISGRPGRSDNGIETGDRVRACERQRTLLR